MKHILLIVFSSLVVNILGQAIYLPVLSSYTTTWQKFTGSANIYGLTHNYAKPLQYNNSVNLMSFTHLKNTTYNALPFNSKNDVVVMTSNNKGLTWDSTCVWSDTTNKAMFPQGGIYCAPGNTNTNNSYLVASGITTNNAGLINGNFYASKSTTATPKNTPSVWMGAQQFYANTLTVGAVAKHDFNCSSMIGTDDGVMRGMAVLANNVNATNPANYGLRGGAIVKGTFNAGAFNWSTDSLIPNTILKSDGSKQLYPYAISAFNTQGNIGYVMFIGSTTSSITANTGWQPIVYKTTNSGGSWSLLPKINFSLPAFAPLLNRLNALPTNSAVVIPQFNVLEGFDAAVGFSNELHIVATLCSTKSSHPDSLHVAQTFGTEGYKSKYTNGKRPCIYDFIFGSNFTWSAQLIDSLGSEIAGKTIGSNGYNDNPWDADANGNKVSSGARIQISRGQNGKLLAITYADSDSLLTGKKWNTSPNVFGKLYDTQTTGLTTNFRLNLTNQMPINSNIANKAYFHSVSPMLSKFIGTISPFNMSFYGCLNISLADVSIPITVSNNATLQQNSKVDHWYSNASFSITSTIIGYLSNPDLSHPNSFAVNIFPNPVKDKLIIEQNKSMIENTMIQISNTVGQIVLTEKLNANSQTIDVSNLTSGVYFIKTLKGSQTYNITKLIKE